MTEYIGASERTAIEIAAAIADSVLRCEGIAYAGSPDAPGLVSTNPFKVATQVRGVARRAVRQPVWTKVGRASGLTARRCRQYAALLALPVEALELAQHYRLSELALRPILSIQGGDAQLAAVQALVADTHRTTTPAPAATKSTHDLQPAVTLPAAEGPHQAQAIDRGNGPAITDSVARQGAPATGGDLDCVTLLLQDIHRWFVAAPAEQRQACAACMADQPAFTPLFVALRDTAASLYRLSEAVYVLAASGDGSQAAAAARVTEGSLPYGRPRLEPPPDTRTDLPAELAGRPAGALYGLWTAATRLQAYLDSCSTEGLVELARQLARPDATEAFMLLEDVSGDLHRLLSAVFALPGSARLDELDPDLPRRTSPRQTLPQSRGTPEPGDNPIAPDQPGNQKTAAPLFQPAGQL
jgi:hypothetical protein